MDSPSGQELYLLLEQGLSWPDIYRQYPLHSEASLRGRANRYRYKQGLAPPSPTISKSDYDDVIIQEDSAAVFNALVLRHRERQIRETKLARDIPSISFDSGPVCIVFMSDLHLGSSGTDYGWLASDLHAIMAAPATYVALVGDVVDNFIIGNLRAERFRADVTIPDEWLLARHILFTLGDRLLLSVAGNHDLWTYDITGVDFLEHLHKVENPESLYRKYEITVDISVGEATIRVKARHSWRGSSQYNDTHGIEKAAKFDKGSWFDIGVGAHTHRSGLARDFNNGGRTGLAVLCGSYKREDNYRDKLGLPGANESAAVAVVLDEEGISFGTGRLTAALEYMRSIYGDV